MGVVAPQGIAQPPFISFPQRHRGGPQPLGKFAVMAGKPRLGRGLVDQIETGKWHIEQVRGQHRDQAIAGLLHGFHSRGARRQIPQHPQVPLTDHPLGDLGDHAEHAGDAALIVIHRTVGEGVVGFLGKPAALEKQQQRLVPGRLAVLEHFADARADIRPDLFPDLVGSRAEHPVAPDAHRRQVSIVAEEGEIRTPQHPHRVA